MEFSPGDDCSVKFLMIRNEEGRQPYTPTKVGNAHDTSSQPQPRVECGKITEFVGNHEPRPIMFNS